MKKQRSFEAAVFMGIALLMSVFFSLLIHSDYKTNYESAQSQYYGVISEQFVDQISTDIRYGKTLDNFFGMNRLFQEMHAYIPENIPIVVVDETLQVLYASHDGLALQDSGMMRSPELTAAFLEGAAPTTVQTKTAEGVTALLQPICDPDGRAIGGLMLLVSENQYADAMQEQRTQINMISLAVVLLCWALLLVVHLVNRAVLPGTEARRKAVRQMMMIVIGTLVAQGLLAYFNMQTQYRAILEECSAHVCAYFSKLITQVNSKGVPYAQMKGISEYLAKRVQNVPMLWNVEISEVLASSGDVLGRTPQTLNQVLLQVDDSILNLRFELSEAYMQGALNHLFLAFLTTMIIAIIMVIEVSRLPELLLARRGQEAQAPQPGSTAGMLRLVAFLLYTGNYMCIPFTAQIIRATNATLFGLSTGFTASLPISAEAFGMMIGLLLVNRFASGAKTKGVLRTGVLALMLCNLATAYASDALLLILLRFLCGSATALLSHSLQRTATGGADADTPHNLGGINAGLLAGITCGGSLGAIASGMIGIHAPFFGGVLFIALFFALFLLLAGKELLQTTGAQAARGGNRLTGLLRSGRVWLYVLCAVLPLNIGLMFIVYFFPAFVGSLGLDSLVTSYGYLCNGLAGIYIGPLLVRKLYPRLGIRKSLAGMLLLLIAAVLLLAFERYLVGAALCAAALMGIFDEYGNPVTSDGMLRLGKRAGVSSVKSLAFLSIMGNIAQMLSPMVYSLLLVGLTSAQGKYGVLLSIAAAAGVVMVLILLFMKQLDEPARAGLEE